MNETIICLLCKRRMRLDALIVHLQQELHYEPERCADCDFTSTTEEKLRLHTTEKGHTAGAAQPDPHIEEAVRLLHNDCVLARENDSDGSIPRDNRRSNEAGKFAGSSKRPNNVKTSGASARKRRRYSSSSDSEDTPRTSKRSSAGACSHPNAQPDTPYVRCKCCIKRVPEDYLERRKHCEKAHLEREGRDDLFESELELNMKKCFPGLRYSRHQCLRCPADSKPVNSATGRQSHPEKHCGAVIACPCDGCDFEARLLQLREHFKKQHNLNGVTALPREKLTEYRQRYKIYKNKLELVMKECFPFEGMAPGTPGGLSSSYRRQRSPSTEESEGEEEDNASKRAHREAARAREKRKEKRCDTSERQQTDNAEEDIGQEQDEAGRARGQEETETDKENKTEKTVMNETQTPSRLQTEGSFKSTATPAKPALAVPLAMAIRTKPEPATPTTSETGSPKRTFQGPLHRPTPTPASSLTQTTTDQNGLNAGAFASQTTPAHPSGTPTCACCLANSVPSSSSNSAAPSASPVILVRVVPPDPLFSCFHPPDSFHAQVIPMDSSMLLADWASDGEIQTEEMSTQADCPLEGGAAKGTE